MSPYLRSLKNKFNSSSQHKSQVIILGLFSLLVVVLLYLGARWMLKQLEAINTLGYFGPEDTLGFILFPLMFLMLSSSVALSLGAFFLSEDNEIYISSPISSYRYFKEKFLLVFFGTAWMPVFFMMPLLLAYQRHFGADSSVLFYSFFLLLLFSLFPSLVGLIASIIFLRFIPKNWLKLLGLVFIGALLFALYKLSSGFIKGVDTVQILRFFDSIRLIHNEYFPSFWFSNILGALLTKQEPNGVVFSISLSISLLIGALIVFERFYFRAYSKSKVGRIDSKRRSSWMLDSVCRVAESFLSRPHVCAMRREALSLTRDVSQMTQLVILSILVLFYLVNLQIFSGMPEFGSKWAAIVHGLTLCTAAFVLTAVCARFVFPSISLEGRYFWILKSAPYSVRYFLWGKFYLWFFVVGLLGALLFGVGSYALEPSFSLALLHSLYGMIVAVGVVSLAIGFGGLFANFSWEYQSQIAAGLGSFCFMVTSVLLIFLSLSPTFIVLFGKGFKPFWLYAAVGVLQFLILFLMIRIAERSVLRKIS